jgi:hypothetical protein
MFSQTIVRAVLVAAFAMAPAAANARLIDPPEGTVGLDPAIATAVDAHGSVDAASIPLDPAIATALASRRNAHPASIPLDPAIATALGGRISHTESIPLDPAIQVALAKRQAKTARPGYRFYDRRLPLVR